MSSTSPNPTPELELHPDAYADPPATPPPPPVTSPRKRRRSDSSIDGRVSSPSTPPGPPPPSSRLLFFMAMESIRAYEPDRGRSLLNKIDDEEVRSTMPPHVRKAFQKAVEEANEVLEAMLHARNDIARAQEAGDWDAVLRLILSFENTMYFRSNGAPRRGYRFPLPKIWLFSACESFAYLCRVKLAERTLNQLMIVGRLTPDEQSWLMGLIAYANGNVRTCIFHLNSIPIDARSDWSRSLLERATVVQNALDVLESLDFSTKDASQQFQQLRLQLEADDSYELLEQCTRKYVHSLYQLKVDAAKSCVTIPEESSVAAATLPQPEFLELPEAASIRLRRVIRACALFNSTLLTRPTQGATSILPVRGSQGRIRRPSPDTVESSFRMMEEMD